MLLLVACFYRTTNPAKDISTIENVNDVTLQRQKLQVGVYKSVETRP